LESLYKSESIGISEEKDPSDYDLAQIEEFERGVEQRGEQYYVELPWHKEVLKQVPDGLEVATAVAHRVHADLTKKGLESQYVEVFKQQLADGIIERIPYDDVKKRGHVWFPHRPVVKEDAAFSKIRPVFNCSLKTGNRPSLNEAAYPGINLLTDLSQLLIKFRIGNHTLLSDIKQAFLQIKLKKEEDKNLFSFLVKEKGRLVPYRYTSIVFGFVSSPFILNFIIKLHVKKFPNDEVSKVLLDNFYVDNLVVSRDNPRQLLEIYKGASERMSKARFLLREWNSSNEHVRRVLRRDANASTKSVEKVLGYNYSVEEDSMKLNFTCVNDRANTKRSILSEVSKVFDPLGLVSPLTVRGKLLLRDLWCLKVGWYEQVSEDVQKKWVKLCKDFKRLSEVAFPRKSIGAQEPTKIVAFCDASKQAYGCAIYTTQEEKSSLLFYKVKVAPLKTKTLPTLELLSVFLAVKCLKNILATLSQSVSVSDVTVAVDAQVVLNWILARKAKTSNLFVNNRLKEIWMLVEEMEGLHGCEFRFRYVPTGENNAGYLTRGMSSKEFSEVLHRWVHGPAWLAQDPSEWPSGPLTCVSDECQAVMSTRVTRGNEARVEEEVRTEAILDLSRFSSLRKVYSIISKVFQFIFKLRKSRDDPALAARRYWIGEAQSAFAVEREYLLLPLKSRPPRPPPRV
jgi:hypothetical protein